MRKVASRHHGWMLILGVTLGLIAATVGSARQRFHSVETPHYVVQTDVSKRFTHLVGQHMEEIYKEYERRFRGYDLQKHDRFHVKVFSHREDYNDAVPAKLKGSAGAFVSSLRLLAAYMENNTEERVFKTLYHEGFHQFLHSSVGANVPLWVNEGFAEYFSEAVWTGERFTSGQVPAGRLRVLHEALKRNEYISLTKLFMMENRGWLANVREGDASLQYAQAWSVVHFLCHARNGRYRPRLLGYVKMLTEGVGRKEAFQKSFGTDIRAFERAWKDYVADLNPDRDEVCRGNMEALMFLGRRIFEGTDRFTSITELRKRLLSDRIRWHMTLGNGRRLDSSDERGVKRLFKCPRDRSRRSHSYILLRNPETDRPELFCLHHPGTVMRAYYVQTSNGYRVRVERVVRATLPPGLVRALKRAAR